jgi:tRNA(Arg) A34 adenosine deaminase TadA
LKWSDIPTPWQVCLEEAWAAYSVGSLPIGAVLLSPHKKILLRERNHLNDNAPAGRIGNNQLAHAELNVLLQLNRQQIDPHPCTLYTLLEPCPLCMGAFYMSGVRNLVYAARDPFAGSTNLLGKTPYLSRKPITIQGPDPIVEDCIIAFQVAAHQRRFDEQTFKEFYDAWESVSPSGKAHGIALHKNGQLQAAAQAGLQIDQIFPLLQPPLS